MSVKRYYGIEAEMQPVEDGPPVDMEWGSHQRYVTAAAYDALQAAGERLASQAHYRDCNWWHSRGMEKSGLKFRECDCVMRDEIARWREATGVQP